MSETLPTTESGTEATFDIAKILKTDLDGIAELKRIVSELSQQPGVLVRRLAQLDIPFSSDTRNSVSLVLNSAIQQVLTDSNDELVIQFNEIFKRITDVQ